MKVKEIKNIFAIAAIVQFTKEIVKVAKEQNNAENEQSHRRSNCKQ